MEGTEASVVIVRRGDPLQALLVACLFSGPLIYKPYDFVLRYPKEQLEERFWKNLDHLAEMAILGHASGIIHFHEQSVIDLIRKTYGYKRAVLRVPPGCVDDFRTDGSTPKLSSSDGQTHIVYASGLARQTSGTQRTNFDDQYHDFRRVLDQGFHLHLYIAYRRPQDTVRGLIRYFELADENPRFHIESSLPYQELVVDLAKYDYAYCHFPLLDSQILPEFHGALANNFFTYLDAGLPVICSPDTTAYASLVSRYGIGLVLENDGFADLRLRLRDVSYTDLVTNVSLMRTRLMHPAKELAAFVKDIASLAPEEQRHSV